MNKRIFLILAIFAALCATTISFTACGEGVSDGDSASTNPDDDGGTGDDNGNEDDDAVDDDAVDDDGDDDDATDDDASDDDDATDDDATDDDATDDDADDDDATDDDATDDDATDDDATDDDATDDDDDTGIPHDVWEFPAADFIWIRSLDLFFLGRNASHTFSTRMIAGGDACWLPAGSVVDGIIIDYTVLCVSLNPANPPATVPSDSHVYYAWSAEAEAVPFIAPLSPDDLPIVNATAVNGGVYYGDAGWYSFSFAGPIPPVFPSRQ